MRKTTKNARGHIVNVRPDIGAALMDCGRRITRQLMRHAEVTAVVAGGSCAVAAADGFSDLDLYVFSEDKAECERAIHESCRSLGGRLDPDAASIHFPLDSPGYLIDDLYIEPGAVAVQDVKDELARVLAAKGPDEGRLFSIRNGVLLADRDGDVLKLIATLAEARVPREYADRHTSIDLDVAVKLIIHSFHRGDYPHLWFWMQEFYFRCVRVLFAREGCFFPGTKRTLTHTLRRLESIPDGFAEFWHDAFARGVRDWDKALDRIVADARLLRSMQRRT